MFKYLKKRNSFKKNEERIIVRVIVTFWSKNTIFITESGDDHFLVIITHWPSPKSNDHKMGHYWVITRWLLSKVIITCVITSHYFVGDGNQ